MNDTPVYVITGVLILFIIYSIFVPPKAIRLKMLADIEAKKIKAKRTQTYERVIFNALGIVGADYERGPINGIITNIKPHVIQFDQIDKGDFSQTLFVNINVNGLVQVSEHEADAQRKHGAGDYGIVSITMTDGRIQCQDILPNGVDPKNLIKLRLNLGIIPK